MFAGYTTGFSTLNQDELFSNSLPNTFVMSYLLDNSGSFQCLTEGPLSSFPALSSLASTASSAPTPTSTSELSFYNNYFRLYSSSFANAYPLLDTMYIPRPCASQSFNLTQVTYFYGQNSLAFNIRSPANYEGVGMLTQMDQG